MTGSPSKWRSFLFKVRSVNVVAVCAILTIVSILYYSRYDGVDSAITTFVARTRENYSLSRVEGVDNVSSTIIAKARDNHVFQVEHYNLSNDYLKLVGHYGKREINSSLPTSDTVLRLEGIENLLNQIKPSLLLDTKLLKADLPHEGYFKVNRNAKEVRCNRLLKGDKDETERAKNLTLTEPVASEQITAEQYLNMTADCPNFIKTRGYIMSSLTKVEEKFPIAYSILMFKDIWQFERLLRAIYRPHNYYCLHVDAKADDAVLRAVIGMSHCFDNLFFASQRFDIQWGTMTVLEPELACMQDLWNKSKSWKYFINLTGQEFPLRTNYELVQILTAYNGANDVESTVERANKDRWQSAGPPPHDLTPVKGSVHVVVSRGFVDYVLHDRKVADLLNWTRHVKVPDEAFFSTVNHNPSLNVPGSYRGLPETDHKVKPFVSRFKNWGAGMYNWPCAGQRVRMICVFGIGDLPMLVSRKEMFVNKFYYNYERFALDCMEELHFNHTRDEYLGKLVFDSRWYAKLGFVLNKIDP